MNFWKNKREQYEMTHHDRERGCDGLDQGDHECYQDPDKPKEEEKQHNERCGLVTGLIKAVMRTVTTLSKTKIKLEKLSRAPSWA